MERQIVAVAPVVVAIDVGGLQCLVTNCCRYLRLFQRDYDGQMLMTSRGASVAEVKTENIIDQSIQSWKDPP